MSIEVYERQQAQLELYAKLAEAEITNGAEDKGFFEYAKKLRANLHEKIQAEKIILPHSRP